MRFSELIAPMLFVSTGILILLALEIKMRRNRRKEQQNKK
jgi:hypothetical protein